jgi:hypothetical protein
MPSPNTMSFGSDVIRLNESELMLLTATRVAHVGPCFDPLPGENGTLPAEPVPVPSRTERRCQMRMLLE